MTPPPPPLSPFVARHIGPDETDTQYMLNAIGVNHLDDLIAQVLPTSIHRQQPMQLPSPLNEADALIELQTIAQRNQICKSYIGQGYYPCHTPTVILRNILENPAWYTAYTPYQAEISQGRLEALVNFQTMVCDLTGMPIANASMLDEATACAEAITMAWRNNTTKSRLVELDESLFLQTKEVILTRASVLGLEVRFLKQNEAPSPDAFAVVLQYPNAQGHIQNWEAWVHEHAPTTGSNKRFVIVATDLLALTLLKPPAEWGADMVVGSTQRLGMPMGAGGPHAGFLACTDALKRTMPGRLVGQSIDADGHIAYRLALQTREQHIRREKATSNICTAQVLPAVVASMYAVYHGSQGLRNIAKRIHQNACILASGLKQLGYALVSESFFDTILVLCEGEKRSLLIERAQAVSVNLCLIHAEGLGISLDETTTPDDIAQLWAIFANEQPMPQWDDVAAAITTTHSLPSWVIRHSTFLQYPVFQTFHSETAMLRYLRHLADKDLALDRSMIALGSCTMKLNATSEMIPITWPEFAHIHPYAPANQLQGYALLDHQLRQWLCQATGYQAISLQPNAGSQGEFAGLLAIRAYHQAQGEGQRDVCLIPSSAHGTNPASAQMVGMQVVVTACDASGNISIDDLRAKCNQYADRLACIMITYPSTHGVFEDGVMEVSQMVHQYGGQVYIDGANMNALVGLSAMNELGGDVSHLNLHKTFCIPHGGGGPGVGPVCVAEHLAPYLPTHQTALKHQGLVGHDHAYHSPVGAVSAAPLGNAAVLPISWMYLRMMGAEGLKRATQMAILNANYISKQLQNDYPTLYSRKDPVTGQSRVAHECILDLRHFKEIAGVMAEDVAKRLADYGFHAPTLSFPVTNTLMCEPTESEPLSEINRFIEAMRSIREEIRHIESGEWSKTDNPLKNAPHPASRLLKSSWSHPYSREIAAYGLTGVSDDTKYWPPVARVDNVYGDRNLFCTCPPATES